MREAGKELKRAVVGALEQVISVPVFDSKIEGNPPAFVLMVLSGETNRSNKTTSVTEGTLELSVTSMREATAKTEVLEDISDEIKQELTTLSLNSPFNLTYLRFENAGSTTVRSEGSVFIQSKPLTYRFRITQ